MYRLEALIRKGVTYKLIDTFMEVNEALHRLEQIKPSLPNGFMRITDSNNKLMYTTNQCRLGDCKNPHLARGFCDYHYGEMVNKPKVKGRLRDYLIHKTCMDCDEERWAVLEFDHVKGKKSAGISYLVNQGYTWAAVLEEIKKCEIVCANCHRIRTYQRQESWRLAEGSTERKDK